MKVALFCCDINSILLLCPFCTNLLQTKQQIKKLQDEQEDEPETSLTVKDEQSLAKRSLINALIEESSESTGEEVGETSHSAPIVSLAEEMAAELEESEPPKWMASDPEETEKVTIMEEETQAMGREELMEKITTTPSKIPMPEPEPVPVSLYHFDQFKPVVGKLWVFLYVIVGIPCHFP